MSLKDAYRERFEAQLAEQKARLELLKAKARRMAADGKIMAYEEIADAEEKLSAMKARLNALGGAGEGAWQEMKAGVEKAWSDVGDACKKAAAKFGGKE